MRAALRRPLAALAADERIVRAVAIFAAVVVLFAGAWTAPLSANDTALHAGMARRMAETGAWLTPELYGAPWYDHLPPFLWLTAASLRTFGASAGAARLPHLLLGLVTVVAVFELLRVRWGAFAGLIGALSLTTTEMFWRYAGRVRPDVPMTAFVTLALLAMVLARARGPRWLAAFGAAAGLAIFSKGPMALAPIAALGAAELASWRLGEPSLLATRWAAVAGGLLVLVPLPWVAYQLATSDGAWVERYIVHQIVWLPRHGGTSERDLFVVPRVLFRIYWPWAPIFVAAGVKLVREWRSAGSSLVGVAGAGAFVALALSVSHRQTEYYLLPAFPAFSALIGWAVAAWIPGELARGRITLGVLVATVLTAMVFTLTSLNPRLGALEKETGRMEAVIPALRAELERNQAKLGFWELHPDRTEWTLNLWLDLAERPKALASTAEVEAFLSAPRHAVLVPAEQVRALLARAPAAREVITVSGLSVLATGTSTRARPTP